MKRYLQCAEQEVSLSNLTKYCACHEKWPSKTWKKFDENSWNVICNARPIRDRSDHDPRPFREWNRQSATRLATEVTFRAHHDLFVLNTTKFLCSGYHSKYHEICACDQKWQFNFTKYCACHENGTWTSPNIAPETESDTWTSPNTAPATKSDLTLLLLGPTITWLFYYLTLLWLDSTTIWLFYYLTLLLLDSSMTWLYYNLTLLLLDSTFPWLYYYFTLLFLDSIMTWLYYYLTLLLLDSSST